ERAARDCVPLPPLLRSTKFMKSAHHNLVGRPSWLAVRPRQRSASSSTAAAPGTCAAASAASLRLFGIGSGGWGFAERAPAFLSSLVAAIAGMMTLAVIIPATQIDIARFIVVRPTNGKRSLLLHATPLLPAALRPGGIFSLCDFARKRNAVAVNLCLGS